MSANAAARLEEEGLPEIDVFGLEFAERSVDAREQ